MWEDTTGLWTENDALGKIRKCGVALQKWSWKEFRHITKKIKDARVRLAMLDEAAPSESMARERKLTCKEIDKLLGLEEVMWRQRSRVANLKEGDQNTRYFHMKATGRRRKNTIRGVGGITGSGSVIMRRSPIRQ